MNKEKSDGMKWLCSAFSILKLNNLIQTNGRQPYDKTGKRQGGRRGTRDMKRDPMRWGEDAGTGLHGKGVHELGMNMVHVYWITEGDTRRISSLQRQWDTVSQKCSFIQMPNAELILETGENERRNNDWFKLWRKQSRRNSMVGSLKEHHGFDTSSITHTNYKKTDTAS